MAVEGEERKVPLKLLRPRALQKVRCRTPRFADTRATHFMAGSPLGPGGTQEGRTGETGLAVERAPRSLARSPEWPALAVSQAGQCCGH